MTPLMGIMKLAEFGLDKAGIRDSMATREKMMQQQADEKFAAETGGMQMGPAFVSDAELGTIEQDGFDKVMGLMDRLGMNDRTGKRSPFEMVLEKTGVVGPREEEQSMQGLLEMIARQNQPRATMMQPTPVPNLADKAIASAQGRSQRMAQMLGGML